MSEKSWPTVYTVMEIQPDYRKHFMGICAGAGSVDYCIRQGLRWWKIPEDITLLRRGDQYGKVIVTPDLADPQLMGWTGNVPQWEIEEVKKPFYLCQQDEQGIDPMRTDEGWPRKIRG